MSTYLRGVLDDALKRVVALGLEVKAAQKALHCLTLSPLQRHSLARTKSHTRVRLHTHIHANREPRWICRRASSSRSCMCIPSSSAGILPLSPTKTTERGPRKENMPRGTTSNVPRGHRTPMAQRGSRTVGRSGLPGASLCGEESNAPAKHRPRKKATEGPAIHSVFGHPTRHREILARRCSRRSGVRTHVVSECGPL
jgi:hypothetical protein